MRRRRPEKHVPTPWLALLFGLTVGLPPRRSAAANPGRRRELCETLHSTRAGRATWVFIARMAV